MSDLIIPIIALALAAALQPLQVIAMLVLLQTEHGRRNGLAYLGGMVAFRLALALVFWWLVWASRPLSREREEISAR